jgi:hypothetical protein
VRRSGAGIRDRINQFDSVSRYNAGNNASSAPVSAASTANQQRYRFNPSDRSDEVVCKASNVEKQQQMNKENSDNFASPPRHEMNHPNQADKHNILETRVSQIIEKDNTNKFTSPSRHRKIKQKIQETFSPITERENAERAIQKVRDTFSPIRKRDNEEHSIPKVNTIFAPNNKKRGTQNSASKRKKSMSPQREKVTTESDSSTPTRPDEVTELRKRLQQLEAENDKLELKNQSLETKCQVLREENQRLEASQDLVQNSIMKEHKSTSKVKKRLSNEHPLISTPLRNHVRVVHEASETNSFISVRKDPFPLFLPEDQITTDRQGGHLGDLGVLTGNVQNQDIKTDVDESSSAGEKRKNEEAIDLLHSAAFLFKTSRRRLN